MPDPVYNLFSWFWLFCPSSYFSPSRDAVDDRFQHTLDVIAGIMMRQLNSWAQELSIDMLKCLYCFIIKYIAIVFFISWILLTRIFHPFFVRSYEKPPPQNGKTILTYARLARLGAKSDFDADCSSNLHFEFYLHFCMQLDDAHRNKHQADVTKLITYSPTLLSYNNCKSAGFSHRFSIYRSHTTSINVQNTYRN